jgi:hypothetical protein
MEIPFDLLEVRLAIPNATVANRRLHQLRVVGAKAIASEMMSRTVATLRPPTRIPHRLKRSLQWVQLQPPIELFDRDSSGACR